MSDQRGSSNQSGPLPKGRGSSGPVVSAARVPRQGTSKPRATSAAAWASNTVLNLFGALGDLVEDFRQADRFFRYKAAILALWIISTVSAFGVACPSQGYANSVSARLVVAGDAASPVYMVKNESSDAWQDVEIVVNGKYRSTLSQLEPNGDLTLSPAVIFDRAGNRAPSSLRITDIEVRVATPEGVAVLLRGGAVQGE